MIIDIIYLISLLILVIRGYNKGIVVAVFSVIAIVLGVIGAFRLSKSISILLFSNHVGTSKWVPLVSYIIVFIAIAYLIRLGAKLVQKTFEVVAMGWANKLCGALLYAFIVSFVFSFMLWLCNKMDLITPNTKSGSKVYPIIEPIAPKVFSMMGNVLPFVGHMLDDSTHFFDKVNQKLPRHVGVN